jgi:hypothetical protein
MSLSNKITGARQHYSGSISVSYIKQAVKELMFNFTVIHESSVEKTAEKAVRDFVKLVKKEFGKKLT